MTKINEDNIRVAAYYIWEQAGRPEGKDAEFWFQACEQFLNASKKKEAAKPAKKAAKSAVKAAGKAPVKKAVTATKETAKKPAPAKTPFYGIKK